MKEDEESCKINNKEGGKKTDSQYSDSQENKYDPMTDFQIIYL